MKEITKAYGLIHIAVILFGFTAILGALISLPSISLVWWRVLIAGIGFTFFTKGVSFLKELPRVTIYRFVLIGVIISVHWIAFFGSVKLAGVSVCLVCMATSSLFAAIFEPIILKIPFNKLDILLGLLIIPGMILVVNSVDSTKYLGIAVGLFSAVLAGIFSSLNKLYIKQASVWQVAWIEMWTIFLVMSIMIIVSYLIGKGLPMTPRGYDVLYLFILGFVCTTIGHSMSLKALHYISAFAINLVVNLEPVYGIVLAAVLLRENKQLSSNFYLGSVLIFCTVFLYPFIHNKKMFS